MKHSAIPLAAIGIFVTAANAAAAARVTPATTCAEAAPSIPAAFIANFMALGIENPMGSLASEAKVIDFGNPSGDEAVDMLIGAGRFLSGAGGGDGDGENNSRRKFDRAHAVAQSLLPAVAQTCLQHPESRLLSVIRAVMTSDGYPTAPN